MNSVYEKLSAFELDVDKAVTMSIFADYCFFNKNFLKKTVLDIYNCLPEELHASKEHLKQVSPQNVFSLLTQLDYAAENSKSICGYVIIKKSYIYSIIDNLYIALPDNIREARDGK